MTTDGVTGPLGRLKVLDLSEGIAGPFCAKLLSDLGAAVIKVETPGQGDVARSYGPFPHDRPHPERSAAFFFLNTGKESVTLDLRSGDDRESLLGLIESHDVVIAGCTVEDLERLSLAPDDLWRINPGLVLTTVSGFGSFGPRSSYASSHIVNCAVGGWAHLCGVPERAPLQAGGSITETLTGTFAAVATLLAVLGRERHGQGEHVDVSAQEAVLAGAQVPKLLYEYLGLEPTRYSSVGSGAGACYMLPTSDGYIGLNALTAAQWGMLCDFLGEYDLAEDPRFAGISWATPDERLEEIRARFAGALKGRRALDLFHEAQSWRIPFGLVPDMAALGDLTPFLERDYFVEVDHPEAGRVRIPGSPFRSDRMRMVPGRPPLLGEHNERVGASGSKPAWRGAIGLGASAPDLPLAGCRILDLSMFFAGPVAAQIAADAGAEVVKVESVQRIDGWRGSASNWDGEVRPWESSPYFNWVNRNKLGITLNLKDPRGVDILRRMVADADIVIENYTPRVMSEFGLDYETLRAINPKLVMLSLSGFGRDVTWRDYVAFGMSTEQMCGVAHLTGYEDDGPLFTGMTGGDLFAGVMGALTLLGAIMHRDATGQGQHIDLSQVEACNLYIGDVMTGYDMTGVDPGRRGNKHVRHAPHGIYPCRLDRWIAIHCRDDAEFHALAREIGRPHWVDDASFAGHEARRSRGNEIDEAIEAYTRGQDHLALMDRLQAIGVPAGAVMNGPELLADQHLAARGGFLVQDRPGIGEKHYPNQPYRFARAPSPPSRRAPLLGEDTRAVLARWLRMEDAELDALETDDVIGTLPLAARG